MPPGTHEFSSMAREFGVTVAVLFVVLMTGITMMWYLIAKQGKNIEEMKEMLAIHCEGVKTSDETACQKAEAILKDLNSFRASEKDLIATIGKTVALHAQECTNGQARISEVKRDTDAIAKSVGELVAIIRDRVKEGRNDGVGKNSTA